MSSVHFRTAAVLLVGLALTVASAAADPGQRSRGGSRGAERSSPRAVQRPRAAQPSRAGERAVPRTAPPRIVRPPATVLPSRPYYYGRSYGYGYPYGYSYGYPYGYSSGYPYGYSYGYAPGYYSRRPGVPYGSVRIQDAPRDAEVFADGYYVGVVDDFDGVFQRLNLEAGPHHIEIREPGYEPIEFDVRVEPGQTITYRAYLQPLRP